jgi:hypothetical protein
MERVSAVLAQWILRHEKFTREKPYIVRNGKSVSLDDILKEIQDDTEEGRKFVDGIISITISMIVKDTEKLPKIQQNEAIKTP